MTTREGLMTRHSAFGERDLILIRIVDLDVKCCAFGQAENGFSSLQRFDFRK